MHLDDLAISPSGFVFDPLTGATFTVNDTARLLLAGLREGKGLDELVASLSERFDAEGWDLSRDVLEFCRLLQEEGLLESSWELS